MLRPHCILRAALAGSIFFLFCGCGSDAPPVRTYQMGEKVFLGHLIYTVYETQWLTQIGQEPASRIPQNRFFLVRISIVNSGGGTVISPHASLEDGKGNQFQELSNGEGVPQWIGYLRQVQPAESSSGNLVFDAPPARYQLRVADEGESKFALIDLPLTFAAETPEILPPGSARKAEDLQPGAIKKP